MGSASTIPYQLRPNKAIERVLFIELLKMLNRSEHFPLNQYKYVGFGALFFEDFKSMHSEFGITDMDCIEYDYITHIRQEFNKPYKFINLHNYTSTDYLSEYGSPDKNKITWLDFADPNQLVSQLNDLEMLGENALEGDVIKFTFNAAPKSFKIPGQETTSEVNIILEYMRQEDQYAIYLPISITEKDVRDNFKGLVRELGIQAIGRGIEKQLKGLIFKPLSCFHYSDGQTMTTVTGIIATKDKLSNILKTTLKKWDFISSVGKNGMFNSHQINVPVMTLAERIAIDSRLPIKRSREIDRLKFSYDENKDKSRRIMHNYIKYYKYLPYFSKVIY